MTSGAYFEQTALVHLDFIYKMALKLARNEDDAHDLVQETFLRAFRFFDRYEPETNCKAWLCQILRNALINRYRRQHVRPQEVNFEYIEEFREGQMQDSRPRLGDPEESLINSTLKEDVRRAFAKLPPCYREALSLSLVGGFSYREIAGMLGCPIGTVMSRIHRARKLMQKGLLQCTEGLSWAAGNAMNAAAHSGAKPPADLATPLEVRSN